MDFLRFLSLLLMVGLPACGGPVLYLAEEGCFSDTECKGDRICHQRECVFPDQIGLDGGLLRPDGGSDAGPDAGPDAGVPDGGLPDAGGGTIGEACEQTSDCIEGAAPICYTEEDTFGTFLGGYCSSDCGRGMDCPEGNICGMIFGGSGACLQGCESSEACRPDYVCSNLLGPQACIPAALAP